MAGAFTHFLICKTAAQSPLLADLNNFIPLLNSHRGELFFGSVSPDLPIIEQIGLKYSWADYMHYDLTSDVLIKGVRSIREKWAGREDAVMSQLVWLIGYASHLIVDATIHPIVEAIVGEYKSHKKEHRVCEQIQDTLIFREVEGSELVDSDFISANLKKPVPEHIFEFWKLLLLKTYFPAVKDLSRLRERNIAQRINKVKDVKGKLIRVDSLKKSLNPCRWYNRYTLFLNQAAGGLLCNLSRYIGVGEDMVYKKSDEITPDQQKKYYLSVKMPGGRPEAPFKTGFDYAVANVVSGWKVLYAGVTNGSDSSVSGFYKNWDLDNGIDQKTKERTFWV